MSDNEENRFDSILLALAEQHKEGVPEVIFNCFARPTTNKLHNNIFSFVLVARNGSRIFGT